MELRNPPVNRAVIPNKQIVSSKVSNDKTGHLNCREIGGQTRKLSFEELLHREVNRQAQVKLSAHAEKRLKERNISLNEGDFAKINQAIQQAAAKGSRDSLLLYGDLALVTSITNRTVVTALDGKNMEQHVFTNIDSAVIIK